MWVNQLSLWFLKVGEEGRRGRTRDSSVRTHPDITGYDGGEMKL